MVHTLQLLVRKLCEARAYSLDPSLDPRPWCPNPYSYRSTPRPRPMPAHRGAQPVIHGVPAVLEPLVQHECAAPGGPAAAQGRGQLVQFPVVQLGRGQAQDGRGGGQVDREGWVQQVLQLAGEACRGGGSSGGRQ